MRTLRRTGATVLSAVTLIALVNCGVFGSTSADCIDLGTCPGQGGDASTDGSLDGALVDGADPDVVVPTGCDLLVEPKDSPPCVTDAVGVFVSQSGKDGATGTRADPFKTIAEAVNRAGKRRVYVCEGDYKENLVITKAAEIYGGFACADFKHDKRVVKVAPATSPAVAITSVTSAVRITDLEIVGTAEKDKAGASAIAVFASGSNDVLFTRAVLKAGPGNDGEAGGTDANYTGSAQRGVNSSAAGGGAGGVNACSDTSSSKGGVGGTVDSLTAAGPGGAVPAVGTDNSGASGGGSCTNGGDGQNGAAREGGLGSTEHGKLEAAGFKTDATGSPGKSGNPGQGGGGGGYRSDVGASGGGAGAGGCGGGGGRGGRTGGSSFALLSFQSTVAFEAGELSSGKGGKGGKGGAGANGQAGGAPGAGAKCDGGTGGAGGGGSGGGGGGGGHSMAIAYVGAAPTLRSNKPALTAGTAGEGGLGGGAGAGPGTPGNEGTAGDPGTATNVPTAL